MFNIYTHIKREEDKKKQQKQKEKERREEVSRKRKMPELVQSYEKKVKNFIYSMVETPIKINEYQSPKLNKTVRDIYNEEKVKEMRASGKFSTGFTFKTFKTDKEKVKDLERNNFSPKKKTKSSNVSFASEDKQESNSLYTSPAKDKKRTPSYIQPSMRFKPRTELERVFESINDYSYGRVSKELIEQQISHLDLNRFKRIGPKEENLTYSHIGNKFKVNKKMLDYLKDEREKIATLPNSAEILKNINKIIRVNERLLKEEADEEENNDKKKRAPKRKYVDNSIAKNVMKEYHIKTHFKAASCFSLNLNYDDGNIRSPHSLKGSPFKLRRSQGNIHKKNFTYDEPWESEENMSDLSHRENINSINSGTGNILTSTKYDSNDLYPVNYNLDYNPLVKHYHKETQNVDPKTLHYLKKISYAATLKGDDGPKKKLNFLYSIKARRNANSVLKTNPVTFFETYKDVPQMVERPIDKRDEEKITIGSNTFYKSQVDLISKEVLKNCNFLHHKNGGNNSTLKAGQGKMMFTNGLTVNEFARKFKIPK